MDGDDVRPRPPPGSDVRMCAPKADNHLPNSHDGMELRTRDFKTLEGFEGGGNAREVTVKCFCCNSQLVLERNGLLMDRRDSRGL